jgi:parvulin-like peptidyl-prolyl isomerase
MQEERSMNAGQEKTMMDKTSSNTRLFAVGGLSLIVLVIAVILGVGLYKVYGAGDTGSLATGVAKVFHLPIAKVGSTYVSYSEYAVDRKALSRMVQYDLQSSNGSMGAPLTAEEISSQVLSRLMSNVIINDLAAKYGITTQQSEVDNLKKEVLSQFKSEADAEADLESRYGWTLAVYEDRVMKPYVLQNALNGKIQNDPALKDAVKKTAQGILDQIKQGASFEDMAKKYGEDGSAAQGGDLGWFGKGAMVPEFETVAFKLKKGELAPELVETQYGYHIMKVDDTRIEKTKDDKGKMVNQLQVKARHILFRLPNLETVLAKAIKETPVKVYGKVENPFTKIINAQGNNQVSE